MSTQYLALPEGVSAAQFTQALAEFRAILGDQHVITAIDVLAPYTKIMLPVPDAQHAPSAAILPDSVEQVQRILAVCNKYKVPVWPISTGRNLGYGSAAPATRGQVVLDLRRMNRILDVDPELCTALVEPGVTYQQLHDYIRERNLPLWLSCPAPSAIAGPLGNTVDRGVGYTPYGEHFLVSCGMEVVLADGQVLRTGMGSIPNSNTWQVFKWGYGPSLDGIFTQSNYGVVTKLGMWLMPAPPAFKPFVVRYPKRADIHKIVETIRPLRIAMIIPNAVVISGVLWEAGAFLKRSDYFQGDGQIDEAAVAKIMADHDLGYWNVYAALYGSPEQIEVNWKIVEGAFKASGGDIQTEEQAGDSPIFRYRADLMRGDMNLQEFGLYNWRGGGGSLWFAPVSQSRGSETLKQMEMAQRILAKHGLDYVGEFIVGWRDMHHIIDVLFDRTDPAQMQRAYACFDELLAEFSAAGYGNYRTNTAFMDKVADTYGPVKRDVDQRLKRALDPNGIIAPGKSGIRI
ncbi:MAG TPA: FAD-binding oxidoreductase [Gammaproteobacteria bacterium]